MYSPIFKLSQALRNINRYVANRMIFQNIDAIISGIFHIISKLMFSNSK